MDVCPILNSEHNKVKEKNTAYIAYLIDEQERRKSTSGGLFFAIATYVIQHDGVVYGAAFDDSMRVTHHRASTKQQVTMLRGSKYVQSDIRLFFQQIIDDLKTKKWFFSLEPRVRYQQLNLFVKRKQIVTTFFY